MYRLFSQGMKEHLAMGKKVTFISPTVDKIPEDEDPTMLTDGKRGSHDYDYNWFSFPGENLEVVIDLEGLQNVRRIESAYYQYGFWLRLLPKKVEYFVSDDGQHFDLIGTVNNSLPIDQYGGQQRDFIAEFESRPARFVKVKAHTIGNTPEWHPGAGRPARMLIDEIVVE
jgi:hexosaminidase